MTNKAPRPRTSELTQGFWTAAREHRLVLQRCADCDHFRHYPQHLCAHCLSADWEWTQVSGSGVVHSYTVTHQAFHPAWAGRVPYVVATIELDEGPRMVTDLDEPPEKVFIGAQVEVLFEDADDDLTLPRFRVSLPSASNQQDPA